MVAWGCPWGGQTTLSRPNGATSNFFVSVKENSIFRNILKRFSLRNLHPSHVGLFLSKKTDSSN
jgi:hypothetical protein